MKVMIIAVLLVPFYSMSSILTVYEPAMVKVDGIAVKLVFIDSDGCFYISKASSIKLGEVSINPISKMCGRETFVIKGASIIIESEIMSGYKKKNEFNYIKSNTKILINGWSLNE